MLILNVCYDLALLLLHADTATHTGTHTHIFTGCRDYDNASYEQKENSPKQTEMKAIVATLNHLVAVDCL